MSVEYYFNGHMNDLKRGGPVLLQDVGQAQPLGARARDDRVLVGTIVGLAVLPLPLTELGVLSAEALALKHPGSVSLVVAHEIKLGS